MTEHGSRLICLPSPLVAVQPCQRMISILPRFDGWYWSTYRTPSGSAGGHARSVKGAASPAATSKVPGEQTQQHPVFRHSRRRSLFRYSKCLTFLRRKGRCLKDRTKPDLEVSILPVTTTPPCQLTPLPRFQSPPYEGKVLVFLILNVLS